jgi:hypothetical protein
MLKRIPLLLLPSPLLLPMLTKMVMVMMKGRQSPPMLVEVLVAYADED